MQLAVEMLADNSKTVVDIASRLGYFDQYHFSRRFKQIKGYSPQIYRKLFIR
jgi:AraC-like DNA-binding protein